MPETRFDKGWVLFLEPLIVLSKLGVRFLLNMTGFPEMIRNVAVVGHLHHGKTALLDMLVYETHKLVWDSDKSVNIPYPTRLSSF